MSVPLSVSAASVSVCLPPVCLHVQPVYVCVIIHLVASLSSGCDQVVADGTHLVAVIDEVYNATEFREL